MCLSCPVNRVKIMLKFSTACLQIKINTILKFNTNV